MGGGRETEDCCSDFLAELIAPGTVGTTSRSACKRPACVAARQKTRAEINEIKDENKELKKELYPLKRRFEKELADQLRTLHANLIKAEDDRERQRERGVLAEQRTKTYCDKLRKSEESIKKLTDDLAQVKADLVALRADETVRLRRAAVESRAKCKEQRYEVELATKLGKEEMKIRNQYHQRAEQAELQAAKAFTIECEAKVEACLAREQAIAEADAARKAALAVGDAEYATVLALRQAARAVERADKLSSKLAAEVGPRPSSRTPEEWSRLKSAALRKARERDMGYLHGVLTTHSFRAEDICTVLADFEMPTSTSEKTSLLHMIIFKCKEGFDLHFDAVMTLMKILGSENYGQQLALFMHYELRMPLPLIHRLSQASCKTFERKTNSYVGIPLLTHPWRADKVVMVPRMAPPRDKTYKIVTDLRKKLGVETNVDGSLAFRPVDTVLQEMVLRDEGKLQMPALPLLLSKREKVQTVLMFDATGYGNQQLNTIALRNPLTSASAHKLHYLGLGNCGDDRSGTSQLLGPNLARINELIDDPTLQVGDQGSVDLDVYLCMDVAAVRHCEKIINSGWCGCSRDFALRRTPKKPETVDGMNALLKQCKCHSCDERFILSHSPLRGKLLPEPCPVPGCTFGHGTDAKRLQDLTDLLVEEQRLSKDTSKNGKARFSAWRLKHAKLHSNIPPGLHGRPMFVHHMDRQILEALHLGALGLPKTPWKYGVLNNTSDDCRETISDDLKAIGHPLDCRRKDDNRCRAQKWYTGERWLTFCAGERGSPGGPQEIARCMHFIAVDLEARGVSRGTYKTADEEAAADAAKDTAAAAKAATAAAVVVKELAGGESVEYAAAKAAAAAAVVVKGLAAGASKGGGKGVGKGIGKGEGRGKGKGGGSQSAYTARAAAKRVAAIAFSAEADADAQAVPVQVVAAERAQVMHIPTEIEKSSNQESLKKIRRRFGSRAQTLINALLAFDAYFAWWFPFKKSIPINSTMEVKQARALSNCRAAIDMHEIFERISAKNQGSFLPHGAIFKLTRDILQVGDVWAYGTSPLELQNAETKRVAADVGAHNITFYSESENRTTMAVSTFTHLLSAQHLRAGEGDIALPDSRRTERVFGSDGSGRMTSHKPKLEHHGAPATSCVEAFVMHMEAQDALQVTTGCSQHAPVSCAVTALP